MNLERLVSMANQIGAFFESQGAHEQAVGGIADHLQRFWEPRMLQAIARHVDAGGQGLRESVAEAVRMLSAAPEAMRPAASVARNGCGPQARKDTSG